MKSLVLLALVAFTFTISSVDSFKRKYEDRFLDYGIYTIMSRSFDKQFLTFILPVTNASDPSSVPTVVPPEIRFAGSAEGSQKWRLDQSGLYTAFELRPTLNENYVLEYIPTSRVLRWFSGWGTSKLWYLEDAGDNFTLIKHKRYSVCLQAAENQPVAATQCDGSISQQWKFSTGKDSA